MFMNLFEATLQIDMSICPFNHLYNAEIFALPMPMFSVQQQ